jgi:hypothetical protein
MDDIYLTIIWMGTGVWTGISGNFKFKTRILKEIIAPTLYKLNMVIESAPAQDF